MCINQRLKSLEDKAIAEALEQAAGVPVEFKKL